MESGPRRSSGIARITGLRSRIQDVALAKDLHLAVEAGESVGVRIATGETAHALLRKHADNGGADLDASSLVLGLGKSAHLGELTEATR
jgi:hypothetical protein